MNVHSEESEFNHTFAHLDLELDKLQVTELFGLLQSGFFVAGIEAGRSVMSFLTERLGLRLEYIHGHISTIFLDGKPVDDLDSAIIRHGSRLALSSPLPGLVGATMRQGGVLSSLRSSITYKASDGESEVSATGGVTLHLKLFNLVMQELGQSLLQEGILVDSSELKHFLVEHHDLLMKCRKILINREPVEADAVCSNDIFRSFELVKLSVQMTK